MNDTFDFEKALDDATGITCIATRDRPYDGVQSERDKTTVAGLTMRDVADCFVLGMLEASPNAAVYDAAKNGAWMYKDVYAIGDIDPIAAVQNALCNIERMMGIFPNVKMPVLRDGAEAGDAL